jgi:SAM-dependent methyltransferase
MAYARRRLTGQPMNNPLKENVREFWNQNPCGAQLSPEERGQREFFLDSEAKRYALEPHILEIVPFAQGRDKDVLEIGCGLGTDGVRWAVHGARYTGVDLTPEAVRLAGENFRLRRLSGRFQNLDAERLPFDDGSFDIVYSHGVIHHTPNTEGVVSEIYRVLRPGGKALVMVYHKSSYNYRVNIMLLRRVGMGLLFLPGGVEWASRLTGEKKELLEKHRQALRQEGLGYLKTDRFLNANTDGPGNPLSKVYTRKEAEKLFRQFPSISTQVRYLNRRRIPFLGALMPGGLHDRLSRRWGWHLYIFAQK